MKPMKPKKSPKTLNKKTATKAAVGRTLVVLAIDNSSSMGAYRSETERAYNEQLRVLKQRATEEGLDIDVAVVTFDNTARVTLPLSDAKRLVIKEGEYRPFGNTALFDGLGLAVHEINEAIRENDAALVVLVTDGEENCSLVYNAAEAKRIIAEKQATGRWTFAFNVPRGRKTYLVNTLGIPAENVREWETTRQGMEETQSANTDAIGSYVSLRSVGGQSAKNFYSMTADLSKLSTKTVKTKLDDLSDQYAAYEVKKESPIRDFVESKTKKDYVVGSSFYQLSKSEVIQGNKEILVMEKGKKAIWGGAQARQLVGLPTDGATKAKVTPGNLAGYDIFIESRSVNRLLVRGTKVLINTKLQKGKQPTWNHDAVGVQ